jgi:hypothetical protein
MARKRGKKPRGAKKPGVRKKKPKGGKKDTPRRGDFTGARGGRPPEQTRAPYEQEPERRLGQYGRAGEPPLIKR